MISYNQRVCEEKASLRGAFFIQTRKGKIMKYTLLTSTGLIGSIVAALFGGWNSALTTLMIAMAIDYVSGCTCAIFKKSPKTKSGGLDSKVGWKGLAKKVMTLALVLVAYRLDLLINTTYIKDAVIIAFVSNELLSIVENAGLMGVPLPKVLVKVIDVLKSKSGEADNEVN